MDINYEDLIDDITDAYYDKFENDFYKISNEVNELYYKEANKIYDSFIQQYYAGYKTKYYIRHWEGKPGTKSGTNLYYGNQIKIHKGKNPYFEINYDGSEMADDYQYDSADTVLNNVMYGIRGVPQYWAIPWRGKYKSRYFKFYGTPSDAFYVFVNRYEVMMEPVFMRRWKKAGWK